MIAQRTTGAVKESVAGLDGVVNSVGTRGIVDLPETETDERHLTAVVELDSWGNHFGSCVKSECDWSVLWFDESRQKRSTSDR